MLKNAYFSHLFRHFWPKFFFLKIRLQQFFGTIKSYLDTKNQKKLWGRSTGIYSDGRMDGRTDGRVQIYSPSQILGSVQKVDNLVPNSIYFYYYKHIKVHLNGFIVQILVETNDIDHINHLQQFDWVTDYEKRLKNVDFLHFFTKTRFSQNAIFALFKTRMQKSQKPLFETSRNFTHIIHTYLASAWTRI